MKFLVKQYATHAHYYEVEASSKEEAALKVLCGEGEPHFSEYIDANEKMGMSAANNYETMVYFVERGIGVDEVIPSIANIEEIVD